MEPTVTTVGQLIINSALPEEYRDYSRVWDKTSMRKFLTDAATKLPADQYREMMEHLENGRCLKVYVNVAND